MGAYVLLNLSNESLKRDKVLDLLSILSLFRNEFNKSTNVRFYLSYDVKVISNSYFLRKNVRLLPYA